MAMDARKRARIEGFMDGLREAMELPGANKEFIAGKWAGLRIALEVEDNIQ